MKRRKSRLCFRLGYSILLLVLLVVAGISKTIVAQDQAQNGKHELQESGTMLFKGQKQLYLEPLDSLGRAPLAHIQLRDQDEPKQKRKVRLKYNPVGWHNYKLYYGDGSRQAWLMNRGHLVGYQFSGLEETAENIVPMTGWLNKGQYVGMDRGNNQSILFYEAKLDNWVANHPNYWLDYQVRAIYSGDELIPRQIELQYAGLDSSGQIMTIQLGSDREVVDIYGVTRVTLDNTSPNALINYLDGTASGTVLSAQGQDIQASAQETYGQSSSSSQAASQFASPEQTLPQETGSED